MTRIGLISDTHNYLDPAIPRTMFRLRFDAGFDMNHPDRAEFFYAEWKEMAFHTHGINGDGVFGPDPHARGPDLFPGKLDYQEASAYFEKALQRTPNRPKVVFGLARSAEALGDRESAGKRYAEFLAIWRTADPDLPELAKAKAFLQRRPQ